MADPHQTIPQFYKDRCVFITGATGFMGKALMEKLLRSCPDLQQMYILVRPKKGKDVPQRLNDILSSKLFCVLSEEQPNFKSKVTAIAGDIIHDNLGISGMDEALLVENVSIVFHAAATVKFDEELKMSVEMNILGVKRMIDFFKKAKKLEALVHVSTAYANCNQTTIEEKIYDPPIHPQKVLDAVEWMDEDVLNILTPKMIGNRPNTYTYTKSIAEYLIKEECQDMPTAIFRPSIVGASHSEPCSGWVDNYNGATGLIAATAAGVMTVMKGDSNATADIIPVDLAINMMIAVAWYTAKHRSKEVVVYHCTTGQTNKLSWGKVVEHVTKHSRVYPVNKLLRVPRMMFTRYTVIHDFLLLVDLIIPSYVLDTCLWSARKKPTFVKTCERLRRAVLSLEYFTSNTWNFRNDNLYTLLKSIASTDRKEFNFDPKIIHWSKYFESYCLGIKRFVLKENLKDMSRARKNLQRLQMQRLAFNIIFIITMWRLLANRGRLAILLWNRLISLTFRILKLLFNAVKIS